MLHSVTALHSVSPLTKHCAPVSLPASQRKFVETYFLITATLEIVRPAKNSRYCCFHYFFVLAGLVVFSFLISFVVALIPLGWLLKLWETVTNLSSLETCVLHNLRHANLQRKFSIIYSVSILIDKTSLSCPGSISLRGRRPKGRRRVRRARKALEDRAHFEFPPLLRPATQASWACTL